MSQRHIPSTSTGFFVGVLVAIAWYGLGFYLVLRVLSKPFQPWIDKHGWQAADWIYLALSAAIMISGLVIAVVVGTWVGSKTSRAVRLKR